MAEFERPARTTVRHGMASCARYGCDRPECRKAESRRRKSTHLDATRGVPATVPALEAARHAKRLIAAGMPVPDIAHWTGLGYVTVRDIVAGSVENIYRSTSEAILFLPIPDGSYRPLREVMMDATASRRRLRALGFLGFPSLTIARQTGLTSETVKAIRENRCKKVLLSTHRAIAEACSLLWNQDPASLGATASSITVTKRRALEQKWEPLAAWDEETIGDPKARPKGLIRRQTA